VRSFSKRLWESAFCADFHRRAIFHSFRAKRFLMEVKIDLLNTPRSRYESVSPNGSTIYRRVSSGNDAL
jgi:hypothetical protein